MKTYARKSKDSSGPSSSLSRNVESLHKPNKRGKITDYFYKKIDNDQALRPTIKMAKSNAEPENRRQTYLDLGQKLIKECRECGFTYDPSFLEDRNKHARVHEQYESALDGKKYFPRGKWKREFKNGDLIIMFPADPSCKDLVNRVNDLMGSITQELNEITKLFIYLYMESKRNRVIGFLSVETIKNGYLVNSEEGARTVCDAIVGVSRIWVAPEFRGRGIAEKLLLSIRNCDHESWVLCDDNCKYQNDKVAFSQPTHLGKLLAQSFLKKIPKAPNIEPLNEDDESPYIVYFSSELQHN